MLREAAKITGLWEEGPHSTRTTDSNDSVSTLFRKVYNRLQRLSCRLRVTNNIDRVHVSRSTPLKSVLYCVQNLISLCILSLFIKDFTLRCIPHQVCNDFVKHKEKNNSTPLIYYINNLRHYIFLQ